MKEVMTIEAVDCIVRFAENPVWRERLTFVENGQVDLALTNLYRKVEEIGTFEDLHKAWQYVSTETCKDCVLCSVGEPFRLPFKWDGPVHRCWQVFVTEAEETDWSVWPSSFGEAAKQGYLELQKHSPLGEDFSFVIDFKKHPSFEDLNNEVFEYAQDFDIDEHVELWIEGRGKRGIPDSIEALVQDAKDIKSMIEALGSHLYEYQQSHIGDGLTREEWNDAGIYL